MIKEILQLIMYIAGGGNEGAFVTSNQHVLIPYSKMVDRADGLPLTVYFS